NFKKPFLFSQKEKWCFGVSLCRIIGKTTNSSFENRKTVPNLGEWLIVARIFYLFAFKSLKNHAYIGTIEHCTDNFL
ncbi:MAG: hypothetical protein RSD32_08085, partial [Oscillospiraceae bacterium]